MIRVSLTLLSEKVFVSLFVYIWDREKSKYLIVYRDFSKIFANVNMVAAVIFHIFAEISW